MCVLAAPCICTKVVFNDMFGFNKNELVRHSKNVFKMNSGEKPQFESEEIMIIPDKLF